MNNVLLLDVLTLYTLAILVSVTRESKRLHWLKMLSYALFTLLFGSGMIYAYIEGGGFTAVCLKSFTLLIAASSGYVLPRLSTIDIKEGDWSAFELRFFVTFMIGLMCIVSMVHGFEFDLGGKISYVTGLVALLTMMAVLSIPIGPLSLEDVTKKEKGKDIGITQALERMDRRKDFIILVLLVVGFIFLALVVPVGHNLVIATELKDESIKDVGVAIQGAPLLVVAGPAYDAGLYNLTLKVYHQDNLIGETNWEMVGDGIGRCSIGLPKEIEEGDSLKIVVVLDLNGKPIDSLEKEYTINF